MPSPLESAIRASADRLDHYIKVHRSHPEVSFVEHVRQRRVEKVTHASSYKLIYLDTLAWKCLADFRQDKPTLTAAMREFGANIERAVLTGRFAFPIGVPTYFELASMVDPATQKMLQLLVDELSQGLCITAYHDRVGLELEMLRAKKISEAEEIENFLCSPIEMIGIPTISLPPHVKNYVDQNTFNKAFFDAQYENPFSIQLEIASNSPYGRWDNSSGIANLNEGKIQHQSEVENLNTGIFLELKGGIEAWFIHENAPLDYPQIALDALSAMQVWAQKPASKAMPTLRILSSLYGLMRFDKDRRYKSGDPNDFMVAASALPVSHALFTDRKFATLLSDKRIGLDRFLDCTVVSGFEKMSQYLKEQM
ncbi:hypothetical protein [Pseudomonas syringae]|uniref:hypothetical protein n=1 Tax=Pseudomonas syringae TaxID=317 RepID=UPI000BB65641|nr:hypothetical protein [Pseudomonas syringae]PBP84781.1 hypothetical protein CCL22_06460 [Pseudomonas syringae]